MKFIIIGLGNFGQILAEDLISADCEVIGVDNNPNHVEMMKERLPSVFELDSTDPFALRILPLGEVDSVIVTIGEDFGASVKTVAALKTLGVPHIQARAIDSIHENVLQGLSIARILKPERESSKAYVQTILSGNKGERMNIDPEHSIYKFEIPERFENIALGEFRFDEMKIEVISICQTTRETNRLGLAYNKQSIVPSFNEETILRKGDQLILLGANNDFPALWKLLK